MGNRQVKLLCHMRVRSVKGTVIGKEEWDLTEEVDYVKEVCYDRLRKSFDNAVRDCRSVMDMPKEVRDVIWYVDDTFDEYDTQIVIIEILVYDRINTVAQVVTKHLKFNKLDSRSARDMLRQELRIVEECCENLMRVHSRQRMLTWK